MKLSILGDSIPNGFGVGKEHSFVNIKNKDIIVKNYAENGLTSLLTLNRAILATDSDIVFIYTGINDFLNGISLRSVCINILKITDMAKKNNIIPVIGIPHEITDDSCSGWCNDVNYISSLDKLNMFRDFIIFTSSKEKFYYIDFNKALKEHALNLKINYDELFFDGVHPNYRTHEYMRKIFSENINKIIEENEL